MHVPYTIKILIANGMYSIVNTPINVIGKFRKYLLRYRSCCGAIRLNHDTSDDDLIENVNQTWHTKMNSWLIT